MSDQVFVQRMLDQVESESRRPGSSLFLPSILAFLEPLSLPSPLHQSAGDGSREREVCGLQIPALEIRGLSQQEVVSLRAGGADGHTVTARTRLIGEVTATGVVRDGPSRSSQASGESSLGAARIAVRLGAPAGVEAFRLVLSIRGLERGVLRFDATELSILLEPSQLESAVDAHRLDQEADLELIRSGLLASLQERIGRPQALRVVGDRVAGEIESYLAANYRYPFNLPAGQPY